MRNLLIIIPILKLIRGISGKGEGSPVPIFEQTIKEFVKNLSNGLAGNDPMTISSLHLVVDTVTNLSLDAQIENITVNGYSQFELTDVTSTLNPPTVSVKMQLKGTQFHISDYNIKGSYSLLPIYGQGSAELNLIGLNLGISASLILEGTGIAGYNDLKLNISLDSSSFAFTGIVNNEPLSKLISSALSENLPKFILKYQERLEELLKPTVEKVINVLLIPHASLDNLKIPAGNYSDNIQFENSAVVKYDLTV